MAASYQSQEYINFLSIMAVLGAKWKFPDRGDTVVKTHNNDTNKEYVDDECLFES